MTDAMIEDWERVRPDLDASGLGIVNRISLLAKHIERHDKRLLSRFDLQPWAYEVLAALRRQGAPYELSPTDLRRVAMLSSGAMTTRLDRLEERGLVARSLSPDDRRSFVITLTPAGLELADRAISTRLAGVERILNLIRPAEQEELAQLLRRLMVTLTDEAAGIVEPI
jgi:DNA-binding MarR family transcriptional regulator